MADRSIATRRKLLDWYRHNRRDLPWRRTKDPYAVWVSEIMLQQTRVAAVIPYYERFLLRFPDVGRLARARIDSVLALWSGLGYYRRARMLHEAARIVAGRAGRAGRAREGMPRTAAGLRRLPGVGAYTAAAIASICFDEPVAVVDGNVERVLSRLHAIEDDAPRVKRLAQAWIAPRAPGDFNQAVMELGATVCTPRAPACPACPLRAACLGRSAPACYPARKPRAAAVVEAHDVGLVVRGGKVLLRKRGDEGLLSGMWELPPARRQRQPLAVVRHGVLDKTLVYRVHKGFARKGRWFSPRQIGRVPVTTAAKKCLAAAGFLNNWRP